MNVTAIAMNFFGGYYRNKRARFSFMTSDLVKARINITIEKYLSRITLYSLLLTFFYVTLGMMVVALLFNYVPIWRFIFGTEMTINDLPGILADFGLLIFALLACSMTLFLLFVLYPRVIAWERKKKIDGHLPYAITWMSFMATTGVIPYMIFKKLAEAEEFFGEVSQEAKLVVKDVELLGYDFISALRNMASVTPSTDMRTFIQGAITNALSGGEMGDYFVSKGQEAMAENRKKFNSFISTLSLISEVYIIGLVAAPLLIIILFAAMMMMSGASPTILMGIIYGFIPLGSLLFLFLTDTLTPEGIK